MKEEKIEQNIERTYSFLFHVLGLTEKEVDKVMRGVKKKIKGNKKW